MLRMADDETLMLTVFLRHDQSKNLVELQERLGAFDYWERFPPAGVEIVSWNVVMGIGQIVTLRFPPHLLAAVERRTRTDGVGSVFHRVLSDVRFRRGARTPQARMARHERSRDVSGLYLQPRQAAVAEPTAWENEFADVLEATFAGGIVELDALVRALNATRVRPREGGVWTAERFTATVAELGR